MQKKDFLSGLNSEQLKAVTHIDGSLLVLAGAGSGKTKVLTTRMAWLIQNYQLGIGEILAVTFTNKAANEMLYRVSSMLNADSRMMWVGTFHSIALRMLRAHYEEAGLIKNFQIIDSNEQQSLIKRLIKQRNLDEDKYPPRELQNFINYQKEHALRANQLSPDNLRTKYWVELYAIYEEVCNRDGLVDFTELLLRCYELLSFHDGILNRYRHQFKHILVDEFQDTNQLQYKWLQLLSGIKSTVFAVGDDDQSIYSFRGAKVGNMRAFMQDFTAPEPLLLEQNYRSTQTILAAANAIIDNNGDRIGKNLWTSQKSNDKIRLYEGYTEEDEAYFVVDEIKSLHNNDGVELSDIAILYRSNAQSRVFEQHLYNRGIAYKVYGGLRFFDRMEIKRVLAYLRLILNPNDNEAYLRVVNFPARGIGAKSIENLLLVADENSVSFVEAVNFLPEKSKKNILKFNNLIKTMQEDIKVLNLPETISYVIETSGLREFFENEKDGEDRIENLNELVTAVTGFLPENPSDVLAEFLAHSVLESLDHQAAKNEQSIQLMTVHAAKGLEFKVVFVVGLEDGLFPHDNSLNSQNNLEEERRLMYVAITRAKEKLYLLRACSRLLWGKRLSAPLSRFVNEIPAELILNISGMSQIGYSQLDGHSYKDEQYDDTGWVENKTSRVELKNSDVTLKIGDMVSHAKFGRGKILKLFAEGKKMTAEIFFIGIGKKVLDLNIAQLEKAY
ncbi:MAG: exodeoxyribonuclease V subunit gamma [Burkholderiales bacterium]|nr:exodeoxyribonuclease V subunit gamma [Burkholderiales bacterium]